MQKPVGLWRNHDYLLLWLGQGVSSLGTGISQFAFPLLILMEVREGLQWLWTHVVVRVLAFLSGYPGE